jgi:hypothetical protein
VLGFQGTAAEPVVTSNDAPVFFVDAAHALANDDNDGTDPDAPMATLQGLIDRTTATNAGTGTREPIIEDYSTIYVNGDLTEAVTITDNTTMGAYVNLIGGGPSKFSPTWDSGAAASPCFVCGAVGWRISGFRFAVPNQIAAVVLPNVQAPYGANATGIHTQVDNNYFDGSIEAGGGLYGIDLHGAPNNVSILNNIFGFLTAVGGFGIASTNVATADAYRTVIAGNWFHESVGGIDASLNVSLIKDNVFTVGGATAMTTVVDLRAGTIGENTVTGNAFGNADYSQPGGFWANAAAPGGWTGNTSEDIAEAEVGDNGLTVLPPAA